MKVGDRVRVKIACPEEWATGAQESLDGALGIIEEIHDARGRTSFSNILVRFDETQKPWSRWQRPQTAFHFEAKDLWPVVST